MRVAPAEPFLTPALRQPSAAELAWRVAYRTWIETPDGPEEHAARAELADARRRLTWEERVGLWERYLEDEAPTASSGSRTRGSGTPG